MGTDGLRVGHTLVCASKANPSMMCILLKSHYIESYFTLIANFQPTAISVKLEQDLIEIAFPRAGRLLI